MNIDEMREVLGRVTYEGYGFEILEKNGTPFLRGRYREPDIVTGDMTDQFTRKWRLSEHMVKSELVQTAFLCALTSAEHRVREHFFYRGQRIYGPHFDCDALYELAKECKLDYRGKNLTKVNS